MPDVSLTHQSSPETKLVCLVFLFLQYFPQEDESTIKSMSLRVLRELIKARPPGVTVFTEKLTNTALESFKETECNVSQASEDLFSPLAGALPPQRMLEVLCPKISKGADPSSLGPLKLLAKVRMHSYCFIAQLCH